MNIDRNTINQLVNQITSVTDSENHSVKKDIVIVVSVEFYHYLNGNWKINTNVPTELMGYPFVKDRELVSPFCLRLATKQ